nr:aspartate 1-decarboxylase [Bacteroidetes bacterium endosymbiont of Geopemphigus sp.]
MKIEVLKSKIHTGEHVYIVNVNNGERFSTYVITGASDTGEVILNGPSTQKVQKDDIVIIISYAFVDFEEAKKFRPWIIFPDQKN